LEKEKARAPAKIEIKKVFIFSNVGNPAIL
jgi:hypothetical protein